MMSIFNRIFKKNDDFMSFLEKKAGEKGLAQCPNCNKLDLVHSISGTCSECKSSVLNRDEISTLQYAIEIIKEFVEKYDEKTPKDFAKSLIDMFDQFIEELQQNKMPGSHEISGLQSLLANGSLGGNKLGGFIRLTNGSQKIFFNKDNPNLITSQFIILVLSSALLYISKLHTEDNKSQPSESSISKNLIDSLNSPNSDKRLSSLGVIINSMWSKDMPKKADAIKIVAQVLFASDMNMVHKAASGLCEIGGLGIRYMEGAIASGKLDPSVRGAIQYRVNICNANPPIQYDISNDNVEETVDKILSEARQEAQYHTFSGVYAGILLNSEPRLRYAIDINYNRSDENQCLISFSPLNIEDKCRDEDCISIVKSFTKNKPYAEQVELAEKSSVRGIRYFGWKAISS